MVIVYGNVKVGVNYSGFFQNILQKQCIFRGNYYQLSVEKINKSSKSIQGSKNCTHGHERARKDVFACIKLRAPESTKTLK